jgi:hypothetical protein
MDSCHRKGAFWPLFFSNQQRGGRECKCAIRTALSILQLLEAFVCAHVLSPGRGSVPYVNVSYVGKLRGS